MVKLGKAPVYQAQLPFLDTKDYSRRGLADQRALTNRRAFRQPRQGAANLMVYHYVVRLHVAMHYAIRVAILERLHAGWEQGLRAPPPLRMREKCQAVRGAP